MRCLRLNSFSTTYYLYSGMLLLFSMQILLSHATKFAWQSRVLRNSRISSMIKDIVPRPVSTSCTPYQLLYQNNYMKITHMIFCFNKIKTFWNSMHYNWTNYSVSLTIKKIKRVQTIVKSWLPFTTPVLRKLREVYVQGLLQKASV